MSRRYTQSYKEEMVKKSLMQNTESITEFIEKHNIPSGTYYKWRKQFSEGMEMKNESISNKKSNAEKFNLILKSEKLSGTDLGEFLRKEGLTTVDLDQWKKEFSTETVVKATSKEKKELRKLKAQCHDLEKNVRRKDKALAEASALLILKKKADLLWGVDENDEE